MRSRRLLKPLGCVAFLALCCIASSAQLRFVQITDPHLFDPEEEAVVNRKALAACVKRINERVDSGFSYEFVVVTGDIGIESLIAKPLPKGWQTTAQKTPEQERQIAQEISKGVGIMSAILSSSKVHIWLFVPGNNDLYLEDPTTISYYQRFIGQLASTLQPFGIDVQDLCPAARVPGNVYSSSDAYVSGHYAFIGFNNASFKNNDDSGLLLPSASGGTRAAELKRLQEEYVNQVKNLLGSQKIKGNEVSYTYVFYHIPEVDDPYLISGNEAIDPKLANKLNERDKAILGKVVSPSSRYSSWFVNQSIRSSWDQIFDATINSRLMGLFAGHLHDWKRETYTDSHWLKSADYRSGSISKLYVCPPMAVKRQSDQPDQARGFMEVSIDEKGRVLDNWGRKGARIFWYNPLTESFALDENEKESEWLRELQLGRVYEDVGRFSDAESAYVKALASKSAGTNRDAVASVQRVTEKQVSPLNRYFFTPGGFSLSLEGTSLLVSTSFLLTLLVVWGIEKQYRVLPTKYLVPVSLLVFATAALVLWLIASLVYGKGWSLPPAIAVVLSLVEIIVIFSIGWATLHNRGRRKIVLVPLTDATDGNLGCTFTHVLTKTLQVIIASRAERFADPAQPVPTIKLPEETDLADLVESSVPGWLGKTISFLMRQASQPEFTIRGSLQTAGTGLMMIVTLYSGRRTLHSWYGRFPARELVDFEEDFAYEVLIYTIAPELYDDAS